MGVRFWHKKCLIMTTMTNPPYPSATLQRTAGNPVSNSPGHSVLRKQKIPERADDFSERNLERETIADTLTAMSDELKALMKSRAGQKDLLEIFREGLEKIGALRDSLTEPFKIAVVGTQGTGKSTLINLLLGEPIMTSHFDETEGSIIKLSYTENAELERKACVKYFTDREGVYAEEEISRDEFYRRINLSTNGDLKKNAAYRDAIAFFEIYSRNPLLRSIQFINTPGLNTVTADFLQRVKHLFIEADLVVWMNKRNQILDSFNSKLIPLVHRDNENMIGILGFADDLYQSDGVNGVRDVLKEFFKETEKKLLLRKEFGGKERTCFFVYNGLAAESALGMKPDQVLANPDDILPGEEAGLRMLWNYLSHGFAFSDEDSVVDEFSLWSTRIDRDLTEKEGPFERDRFIHWLYTNRFIKKKDGGYVLTEKGRALSFESSMLPAIELFAQEVIFNRTLQEKIARVKNGVTHLYGRENVLAAIKKKRNEYQKIVEEKDRALAREREEREALKESIRQSYREWYLARIQRYSMQMSENLVKRILEEIGKRIGKKDLWKEFLKQMTPQMFRGDDEGPVMTEISRIIDAEFEALAEAKTERIIAEAVEEVQKIIAETTLGSLSGSGVGAGQFRVAKEKRGGVKRRGGARHARLDDSTVNEVMKGLMDKLGKMIGDLVKKMAASDMKKKGMTKFKKLFVKMFRKIFVKLSLDYAKEQAEIAPAKGIPFVGWLLIVKDLVDLGLMLNDMLDELKGKLESAILENQDDFFGHFKKILEPTYEEVQNAVFEGLEEATRPKDRQVDEAFKGMALCDRAIRLFETYQLRFETNGPLPLPDADSIREGSRAHDSPPR